MFPSEDLVTIINTNTYRILTHGAKVGTLQKWETIQEGNLLVVSAITGTPVIGDTVTGAGANATLIRISGTNMYVSAITGTFINTESLTFLGSSATAKLDAQAVGTATGILLEFTSSTVTWIYAVTGTILIDDAVYGLTNGGYMQLSAIETMAPSVRYDYDYNNNPAGEILIENEVQAPPDDLFFHKNLTYRINMRLRYDIPLKGTNSTTGLKNLYKIVLYSIEGEMRVTTASRIISDKEYTWMTPVYTWDGLVKEGNLPVYVDVTEQLVAT